jgi:threonylcarbamoyladenosine tRNA methylthiotransferase MtaB
VLTGAHLGTWGRDRRPRERLAQLIEGLLPSLGEARLRLSSIDPHEVDDELIALIAEHPRSICRHLHLPVQSGDPDVLRRMRRGHTVDDFAELSQRLASKIEGIAIGTDVIVGFPAESAAAFERTHGLLARLPLSYHHVFSYSPRQGTDAARMADQVPEAIKAERSRWLRELSLAQEQRFAAALIGQRLDAVVEYPGREGTFVLTDNYLRLALPGSAVRPGSRVFVELGPDARIAALA